MRPFEGGADGATLWDPEGYDHASKSFKAVADDSSESENDGDETTTDDEAPEGYAAKAAAKKKPRKYKAIVRKEELLPE